MTALDSLRTKLIDLRVRLSSSEGKLVIDAPAGVLTPEIKSELTEHKPALMAAMSGGLSNADADARIRDLVWDGTSLADVIENGRRHNEEVRKRR